MWNTKKSNRSVIQSAKSLVSSKNEPKKSGVFCILFEMKLKKYLLLIELKKNLRKMILCMLLYPEEKSEKLKK